MIAEEHQRADRLLSLHFPVNAGPLCTATIEVRIPTSAREPPTALELMAASPFIITNFPRSRLLAGLTIQGSTSGFPVTRPEKVVTAEITTSMPNFCTDSLSRAFLIAVNMEGIGSAGLVIESSDDVSAQLFTHRCFFSVFALPYAT